MDGCKELKQRKAGRLRQTGRLNEKDEGLNTWFGASKQVPHKGPFRDMEGQHPAKGMGRARSAAVPNQAPGNVPEEQAEVGD